MAGPFKAACIQLNGTDEIDPNIATAIALIRAAREAGADLILTPENTDLVEQRSRLKLEKTPQEAEHPAPPAFSAIARELGVWLLVGSIGVRIPDEERVANRSLLFGPDGREMARYDKIHMFDVDLDGGESYRESHVVRPGDRAALAPLPWGPLGLSVCYDLRFPHLYRALALSGAQYLSVPAAFTRQTGQAHWHTLLGARAIENGCYVLAPAQCGDHDDGRQTFGHSLIIDPWGDVIADGGEKPGFLIADIDPVMVTQARRRIPSLSHDRNFRGPSTG